MFRVPSYFRHKHKCPACSELFTCDMRHRKPLSRSYAIRLCWDHRMYDHQPSTFQPAERPVGP